MEIFRLAKLKKYKVVIPYTESGNRKKLFKIEYKIEAENRRSAISNAEAEFNSYNASNSASWMRFVVRSKIRAWRLDKGLPETADKIDSLVEELGNKSEKESILEILKLLGKIEDASVNSEIIKLFGHPDPEIVCVAIEALGKIGDPGDFSPVIREYRYDTDPAIKASILIAASKLALPDDNLTETILDALKDSDDRVRANAVEASSILGDFPIEEYIAPMLKDEHSRVRANAIVALWPDHDHSELLEVLKDMVSSSCKNSRTSAIFVLSKINIPGRLELLNSMILSDEDQSVRETAKETLFEIQEPTSVPYWIKLIENESDFSAISEKILELGEKAISPLLSFQGENKSERENAALLLDQLEQQILRNKSWMDWIKTKQKRLFHQQSKPNKSDN